MLDFFKVSTKKIKSGVEIFPKFIMTKSDDLMIRGGDFYAVWLEEAGLWSTEEDDVMALIDRELSRYADEYKKTHEDTTLFVHYMWDADSGSIDKWHKYCQKQCRDNFHMLDENLIFSNTQTNKKDYASRRLNYPLESGPCPNWDLLLSTLYSEEERRKIEWAIGAIVTGDSKHIQKFMVFYGAAGTGKSTVLNIIQKLFEGYYSVFDARALGSSSNVFALEAFKNNPLVAIQHDGDLSRIEDNTRLNSLVSHEMMTINEKFKSTYSNRFKCFLFMGSNKPVKITDGKSGLIRRLIDVSPSGKKLNARDYKRAVKNVEFELGAIANHCKEVYLSDPGAYDDYIPVAMMGASNDFYNYVMDCYHIFKRDDGVTLKAAWEMYKTYCEEAKVPYDISQRIFREELKNYFWNFDERGYDDNGTRVRSYYSGFRTDKFEYDKKQEELKSENKSTWLDLIEQESIFDMECADCPAQYTTSKETPKSEWDKVETKLSDIDTSKLHYVKVPENHIVIDFDLKNKKGEKDYDLNLDAASNWPVTYAETSKGGAGIHLHYLYSGDVSKLSRLYSEDVEIKVFTGKSSLRRKLTKCNDKPITTISSGLPLKGEKKVIDKNVVQSERGLRTTIKKCLNKEVHPSTKSNVDYIYKLLDDYYKSGEHYDVSDMKNAIFAFAASSSHQAETCIKLANMMHFCSDDCAEALNNDDQPIVFYDIEVFPNLLLVNWKIAGEGKPVVRMINPTSAQIEELIRYRLVGFNCRDYDNHIIYARLQGYDNEQIYNLSQKIISGDRNAKFREAYNISYTDVYDFASAGNKKSLKKLEIEMGIHHQELGLPWDQPVPEELWDKVAEYCDNDVIATEAAFHYLNADWTARQILADLANGTVNDTTNTLTTKFIFGTNRHPQDQFCYRNLAEPVMDLSEDMYEFLAEACPEMMSMTHGEAGSFLPYFEGYKYEYGKSTYKGRDVGEGGYVESQPGVHGNVALLDVSSMHPHSTIAECLFGPKFTRAFRDIVEGRVSIKHEAWDEVNSMLDGKLTPYVQKVINGEMSTSALANALKTAINSVYGLTAAKFDNAFRDPRNIDNIVAKRGALFMIDLACEVEKRGFTVAHIKTDSIKIPDATPEIIDFVMNFGKQYGYTFEHEATYDKMCLVNKAVYIAKYATAEKCEKLYGYVPGDNKKKGGKWTATGDQFAVPYVHKTLFTHEPIAFEDMCESFQVKKGALYLDINENLPDVSSYENDLHKLEDQYKKGKISDTIFEKESASLMKSIEAGHDLKFVGRIGQFCPIKPGHGAGTLYRVDNGKNYAASGSTGYRWLESELIQGQEDIIDRSYFIDLVDKAADEIRKYTDFEWFVSDDEYIRDLPWLKAVDGLPEDIPFDLVS